MDHWGDPWADGNATHDKSANKTGATSPLPPTLSSAPGLLNGFLDDAGWGNDESFGEWATVPANDGSTQEASENIAESSTPSGDDGDLEHPHWAAVEKREESSEQAGADWSATTQDTFHNVDHGWSDTSDSSATVQADDGLEQIQCEASSDLAADDDSSARPSTSPSEISQNDAPTESARTSIEEEHGQDKEPALPQELDEEPVTNDNRENVDHVSKSSTLDSNRADSAVEHSQKDNACMEKSSEHKESGKVSPESNVKDFTKDKLEPKESAVARPHRSSASIAIDPALLDEIFPDPKTQKDIEDAPGDPIYSTSGRKTWYRLTRKQTLREYNAGTVDDNHIRITWANSHVRSQVNKIVGRWAREDRMSGTGSGARASFYWDTPASIDPVDPRKHSRTMSSVPAQRAAAPVRQSLPPLSTKTSAAFSWSVSSAAPDPWNTNSPASGSTSSPIVLPHNTTQPEQATQKQILPPVAESPGAADWTLPAIPKPPTSTPVPWTTSLDDIGTEKTLQRVSAAALIDDEDDWGEMVAGVNESTSISAESKSPIHAENSPQLAVFPAADPSNTSLLQDQSADPVRASPIVRLKSTVSPTSSLFGAKRFIPIHAEEGPIGPSILKRSISRTIAVSGKRRNEEQSLLDPTEPPVEKVSDPTVRFDWSSGGTSQEASSSTFHIEDNDFSNPIPNAPKAEVIESSTPPQQFTTPIAPNMDSWADADFSFFESSLPSTAPPSSSQPKHDPSDPFSFFETHSTTPASTRNATPPPSSVPFSQPILPPTTTTTITSAERQKIQEENTIAEILSALPDLSYMLR